MSDEPMNLPGDDKKPGDHTVVIIKDPTKQNFWRFRNITLLALTATLPALTGWIYTKSEQGVANYFNKQKSQDERIRALEQDTQERLKELESDHANNKAIWAAISEERTKMTEIEIEIRVIQRLFDREFRRGTLSGVTREREPSTTPVPPPAERPLTIPPPLPVPAPVTPPKPPPVKPDQFRLEYEQKFPNQKRQEK